MVFVFLCFFVGLFFLGGHSSFAKTAFFLRPRSLLPNEFATLAVFNFPLLTGRFLLRSTIGFHRPDCTAPLFGSCLGREWTLPAFSSFFLLGPPYKLFPFPFHRRDAMLGHLFIRPSPNAREFCIVLFFTDVCDRIAPLACARPSFPLPHPADTPVITRRPTRA